MDEQEGLIKSLNIVGHEIDDVAGGHLPQGHLTQPQYLAGKEELYTSAYRTVASDKLALFLWPLCSSYTSYGCCDCK